MRIDFHPLAARELEASADWYAERSTIAGRRFAMAIDEALRKVLEHYESLTDEQAIAEDEAEFADRPETAFSVPVEPVSAVRELIRRQQSIED